ncbi:MAG: MarC family protein [Cyanobacteriota bacterium ELA615]
MQLLNEFDDSFIFTIAFLTLGPIKIIGPFAKMTANIDPKFKKQLAIYGAIFATIICLLVALLGKGLVEKYHLIPQAIIIAGGLVLLISALRLIFPPLQPEPISKPSSKPLNLAISPLASPIIVTPMGIAAILVFVLFAQGQPAMIATIYKAILIMMFLDFLVMFFIDKILKIPGLMAILQIMGSILVFIQVALAVQTILLGLVNIGIGVVK